MHDEREALVSDKCHKRKRSMEGLEKRVRVTVQAENFNENEKFLLILQGDALSKRARTSALRISVMWF